MSILFGSVVLVGYQEVPAIVIIASMLATTIAVATPLTLGALSGVFCERSGVVNIGIEGMMLAAAFFGWFASIYMNSIFGFSATPSILLGVLAALLTGGLFALLHAALSITFKVDQIIGGTVINILAIGVTGFLNRQLFFEKDSIFGGQVPHAPGVLPRLHVPITELFQTWCGANTGTCFTVGSRSTRLWTSSRSPSRPSCWSSSPALSCSTPAGDCAPVPWVSIPERRIRSASMCTSCAMPTSLLAVCWPGMAGAYFTLESVHPSSH